jgi:hypothetical protein
MKRLHGAPRCRGVELKTESFQTFGTQLALTEHAQGAQEYKGVSVVD